MVEDMLFDALSDRPRRAVLTLLARNGPMRAGELAEALHLSAPATSRHLKILRLAGLIADERVSDDARLRYFRLEEDGIAAAQAYLDQLQADWKVQLRSFKQRAERTERKPR